MTNRYTHGHHASVPRSHTWRTAENSAAYLLPRLAPGQRLLDVGCGPGTITVDLASRLEPGLVVGLDPDTAVVRQAAALQGDATFDAADVHSLPFAPETFFAWAPSDPRLDRWMELYHQVTRRNGAEADAGRHLLGWVQRAGFEDVEATSSTWTFADDESRHWWGGLWAERVDSRPSPSRRWPTG